MGIVIIIAIIIFFIWVGNRSSKTAGKTHSGTTSASGVAALQARARLCNETHSGIELEVIVLEVKGSLVAPYPNFPFQYQVHLLDLTEGFDERKAILCRIEDLQEKDSLVFEFQSPVQSLPSEYSSLTKWSRILTVPTDSLLFPNKGRRSLGFYIFIPQLPGQLAECSISYNNTEFGYIDSQKNRLKAEKLTCQLAIAVSAADGSMDACEGKIIKDWITKKMSIEDDKDDKKNTKNRLNNSVKSAMSIVRSGGKIQIEEICDELAKIAPPAERYNILELCLHIASADGIAAGKELEMLNSFSKWLQIDATKFRSMVDKIIPVSFLEVEDEDALLGINSGMDAEEIRKHLLKEYRKWNTRAHHSDPKIREQASKMIQLIAEARSRHLG